jgi:hypothetical protein
MRQAGAECDLRSELQGLTNLNDDQGRNNVVPLTSFHKKACE